MYHGIGREVVAGAHREERLGELLPDDTAEELIVQPAGTYRAARVGGYVLRPLPVRYVTPAHCASCRGHATNGGERRVQLSALRVAMRV
jgi:hypothetical protein